MKHIDLKIRFVDDNEFMLKSAKLALDSQTIEYKGSMYRLSVKSYSTVPAFTSDTSDTPDIVVLDIIFNKDRETGYQLMQTARHMFPSTIILMYSEWDRGEVVSRFIKDGADNFISKQTPIKKLGEVILKSYKICIDRHNKHSPFNKNRNKGNTIQHIAERIPDILKSQIKTVHINGETGTGKELVSNLFEEKIGGSVKFVKVNCATITPSLSNSELFGYVKGAFTGATSDKIGLIEAAHNGWIFLDEIDCLPVDTQASLLRIIEQGEVRRVGETISRKINFRMLTATNKNIEKLIALDKFRPDLWQRLSVLTINLPPLRQRKEEIPVIATKTASELDGGPYSIPLETMNVLKSYSWKNGNIRELINCLVSMTEHTTDSKSFEPCFLPKYIMEEMVDESLTSQFSTTINWNNFSYRDLEEELYINVIKELAKRLHLRSMNKIAQHIGLPRSTFFHRLKKLVDTGKLKPDQLFFDKRQKKPAKRIHEKTETEPPTIDGINTIIK